MEPKFPELLGLVTSLVLGEVTPRKLRPLPMQWEAEEFMLNENDPNALGVKPGARFDRSRGMPQQFCCLNE